MTELRELLMEIADDAPDTEMAGPALRTARRRRMRRLAAAPAGLLVVAGLAVGGVTAFQQAAPDPAGPAEHLGVLNAHVPPALPARGVAPARLAYQDYCRTSPKAAAAKGACAQWRILTADGKQYRVPGSLGAHRGSDDILQTSRLFAVSGDGGRVMYYQAGAQRVVVRDLATGDEHTVAHLPAATVRNTPVEFMLSGNGTWAGVETGTTSRSATSEPTPKPRLVEVSTGTTTRLPRNMVFTAITDDGTAYLGSTQGGSGVTHYDHTGKKISGPVRGGGVLSPDGTRAALTAEDSRTVVIADARTGRTVARHTPPASVPKGYYDVASWRTANAVTIAGPLGDHADTKAGRFGYTAVDPDTAEPGAHGSFTLIGTDVQVTYGAIGR